MIKGLRVLSACAALSLCLAPLLADTPKPKRINRAIELLAQGQPIYYTGSHSGTAGSFEQGKQDAQTYADYISYDMEHAPYGIMLTHADTPGAVRAFVEAVRLPIHKQGVGNGISEGRRGVHGAEAAAKIWGVSQ